MSVHYVCAVCGGSHVQHAMWVDLNTNKPQEDFGSWCNWDNSWCADCDEHVLIVKRDCLIGGASDG